MSDKDHTSLLYKVTLYAVSCALPDSDVSGGVGEVPVSPGGGAEVDDSAPVHVGKGCSRGLNQSSVLTLDCSIHSHPEARFRLGAIP